MYLQTALLVKTHFDSDWAIVDDDSLLGKSYIVDLSYGLAPMTVLHAEDGRTREDVGVYIIFPAEGWFPLSALYLVPNGPRLPS